MVGWSGGRVAGWPGRREEGGEVGGGGGGGGGGEGRHPPGNRNSAKNINDPTDMSAQAALHYDELSATFRLNFPISFSRFQQE